KAVFQVEKTDAIDIEELELQLIDAGLEEIDENDGILYIYGDYTDFGNLSKALEDLHISAIKSELQRIPTSSLEFTEEQLVDIEKLLDKIDDDDDVQAVFTNIA